MRQQLAIALLATLAATACGKKSSDSDSDSDTTDATSGTTVKGQGFGTLNLSQKLSAATPAGFKASTSLSLASASDVCSTTYPEVSGVRPEKYYSCLAAFEIREAFFQRGPTVIDKRLASVDTRLNMYVGQVANFEVPCFDPTNTTERTAEILGTDPSTKVSATIPAFALKEYDIATTFSDGYTLDLDRKYSFSCSNTFESNGATFNILVGQKDKIWNLAEIQTIAADSSAEYPFLKTMMTLDEDENMEVLFGMAGTSLGKSSATNPEGTYATTMGTGKLYEGSAGFAQFVVRPLENILGASSIMNNGCERRLIMNDKAVYVEVNGNNYGNCFASDIWTADSGYTGPAYSSARAAAKGCLKVSGSVPEPMTDLTLCEESGLLVANEAGSGYEDPFARYGIFQLSTNTASAPTGGFSMRAYHGNRIAPNLGAGTNELQYIPFPEGATVEVDGFVKSSFAFAKSSTSGDSDAGKVTAACNAAAASREVTYTQKSEFAVQTWVDLLIALPATKDLEGKEVKNTAESAVAQLNEVLAYTGDEAPKVTTALYRSLGASFKGVGSGTFTLKYNDTTVGTATVDQTDLTIGISDVVISFSTVPTVEATGKFTLEFSGKTLLSCTNSTSTTRTVNTHAGLGALTFYTTKEPKLDD